MVYAPKRMKMTVTSKVPNKTKNYYKISQKLQELEFSEEGDSPQPPEESHAYTESITIEEVVIIAEFITKVDVEYGLGVEAMYLIMRSREEGATVSDAIKHCKKSIKEELKNESRKLKKAAA